MPQPKVTEDQYLEALSAIAEHGNRAEAARALGLAWSTINNRVCKGRELYGETVDPIAAIPDGFDVKGTSTYVREDGTISGQWIKTTRESLELEQIAKAIEERFGALAQAIPPNPLSPNEPLPDLLSLYILADAHLGMYAWGRETGENYDLSKGVEVIRTAIDRLVSGSPESETGVILELGDFFHADDSTSRTPRSGHSLDTDGRHAKVIEEGISLTVWAIERALEKHDNVLYVSKRGNHDPTSGMILPAAMSHLFRNEPRVTVETDTSKHWFYQHGKTMLAGTHGDTLKMDKMPGFMSAEEPKIWGNTDYRYGWTGHLHHRRSVEFPGVTCEIARTLAARDAYHTEGGYKSVREMLCVVYSAQSGEVQRLSAKPYDA